MKRAIKIIFIAVFFVTIIFGGLILFNQPNDDILNNKMDCIVAAFMLTPVLILEIEIYSICTYGFTKEKNKTFLKILSLAIALLFFGFFTLSFYTTTNKIEAILLVVFLVYVLLKLLLLIFQKKI